MKYTTSIDIDLPRDKVVELFDNPKNMYEWMPGLQNFEHLSGQPGQPGAKSKLQIKMGKRSTEMIETITKRELPEQFHGVYETNGVQNIQENYFEKRGPHKTTWTSHSEFRFNSFMMKLIGWMMPGAFKKQSKLYMEKFKEFAERNGNG